MTRRVVALALLLAALGPQGACGGRNPAGRTTPKASQSITLRVLCSVPDTRLYYDGGLVLPRCGPEGVELPATIGAHRLEARHEHFFAEFVDLNLTPTPPPVAVTMRPVPALLANELEADAPP